MEDVIFNIEVYTFVLQVIRFYLTAHIHNFTLEPGSTRYMLGNQNLTVKTHQIPTICDTLMLTLMDRDIEFDGIDDPIGTFFLKLDKISYRSNDYLGRL